MKLKTVALACVLATSAQATTPAPGWFERRVLNRVRSIAQNSSAGSETALRMLDIVAEGRPERIDANLGPILGIQVQRLDRKAMLDPFTRSYALRKIVECPQSEALSFLQRLGPEDFAADTTRQIWPAAQEALLTGNLRKSRMLKANSIFLKK